MITFGRFGHVEDIQKDKELFLARLNFLIYKLNSFDGKDDYKEEEIVKPLKEKLNSFFKYLYPYIENIEAHTSKSAFL